MASVEDHAQLASDAELITRVRAGDRSAFGDLYTRHAGAAASLARQFSRSGAEADDLVSEAFARVLDGMLAGKGPDTAFRAYLFTTLRNTAYDRTRKDKRLQFTDDIESHEVAVEGDDPVLADLETGLVGKAFASLPERWQTVLWHTQVDGQSAAEVGVLLGMAPNAVTSLAFRAREGLREAYLQAHLAETADDGCQTTVNRLGAWARGGLSKREQAQVDAHLETCERCRSLAAELTEINSSLRGLLAPLLLGGAALGYVSTLGPVVPLVQLGAMSGGAAAVGGKAAGGHALAGLGKAGGWGPGAVMAGVAAVAAIAVAGVVIALSGNNSAHQVASNGAGSSAGSSTNGGSAGAGSGAGAGGAGSSGSGAGTGSTGTGSGGVGGGSSGSSGSSAGTGSTGTGSGGVGGGSGGSSGSGTGTGSGGAGTGATAPGGGFFNTSTPVVGPIATSTPVVGPIPPTPPPTGPNVSVGAASSVSPGMTAGGSGSLTLTIENSGGSASPAGQSVVVDAPAGFTVSPPATGLGLRRSFAALAAPTPGTCTATGNSASCSLPAIEAGAALTLNFPLSTRPTAEATGQITVSINGNAGTRIPVTVASGYATADLTSGDLVRGAVNRVHLVATLKPNATNVGSLSIPTALAPGMTILGLAPAQAPASAGSAAFAVQPSCAIAAGVLTCPSDQAGAGVDLAVQVAAGLTPGRAGTQPASDQGKRPLRTGPLMVSDATNGGYASVTLDGPDGPLRPGSTVTIVLRGTPDGSGVLVPSPIRVPVQLAPGLTIVGVPRNCALPSPPNKEVICTPTDGSSPTFPLTVKIARDAGASQPLGNATVGSAGLIAIRPTGGTSIAVDPTLGGYTSITLNPGPLLAGTKTTLTVTGNPAPGFTDPGTVTLSNDLGGGLAIVAIDSGSCTFDTTNGTTTVCNPTADASPTTWVLEINIPKDVGQGTLTLPTATLPGARTMRTTAGLGADLTIRAAATSCSQAATLSNGDFESPVVPGGAGATVKNTTNGLAWTTTASDSVVEFWRNSGDQHDATNVQQANNGVAITADSGKQWVELNANETSALYQDIATVPGSEIRWTISHRARAVPLADGESDKDVMKVQIGGSASTLTDQIPDQQKTPLISDGPGKWVQYTGVYTVPAGQKTTTFQFAAVSSASHRPSYGNFLDNVSLRTVPCLVSTTTVANLTSGDGANARPGDTLRYTTTTTNVGGDGAANVAVDGAVPANTTLVPGSVTPLPAHVGAGEMITSSYKVTVDADVPDKAVIHNNALITYQWPPSTTSLTSISTTASTTVLPGK